MSSAAVMAVVIVWFTFMFISEKKKKNSPLLEVVCMDPWHCIWWLFLPDLAPEMLGITGRAVVFDSIRNEDVF